ncbi:MAG: helix-turn-helix transcriptional regulator [Pseudomonadota bacterium]
MAQRHPELPIEIDIRPQGSVLARGDMTITVLRDGVKIMRGRLRGLRDTVVNSQAEPGLHIEARLTGHSTSKSVDGSAISLTMEPGQGHILGLKDSVRWRVHVPAQEAMEVVSIRFPQSFIDHLFKTSPDIAWRLADTIENDRLHMININSELRQMARELLDVAEEPGFGALRMEGLALSMLAGMFEILDTGTSNPGQQSSSVMALIENLIENSAPKIWTVKAIGEELGLSEAKIKRSAVTETGISIGSYLSKQRLDTARSMLGRSMTVAEVARATGYGTAEALSKAFVRAFGMSPSTYRKSMSEMDSDLI